MKSVTSKFLSILGSIISSVLEHHVSHSFMNTTSTLTKYYEALLNV